MKINKRLIVLISNFLIFLLIVMLLINRLLQNNIIIFSSLIIILFILNIVSLFFSASDYFMTKINKSKDLIPSVNSISKKELIDFSVINDIVLRNGSSSEFQKFSKILPETINKKFKVVKNDHGVSGVIESTAIKLLSKNGLYKASVSPEKLMEYSDGTLGSIVQENGQIKGHSGFSSAEASVFAPMAAMQILTIITSQYYLNGLNEQLKNIESELNRLKHLNYGEDNGKLFSINEILKSKFQNRQPDESDFSIIENCKVESVAIAGKYLYMLEKQVAPDKTRSYVNEHKRIDEIINSLNQSDGEYYISVISAAYNMSLLADIAYLRTLAYLNSKKDYNLRIKDYILNMEQSLTNHENDFVDGAKDFYNQFEELIMKYRVKWSQNYLSDKTLDERINKYKDLWNDNIYSLEKSPCIELKNNILEYLKKPREVLICIDEKSDKTFLIEDFEQSSK